MLNGTGVSVVAPCSNAWASWGGLCSWPGARRSLGKLWMALCLCLGFMAAVQASTRFETDPTFTPLIESSDWWLTNYVTALLVQPDDRVLVLGGFDRVNGVPRKNLARLHPDGTLDTSFNTGTWVNRGLFAMALQPDGKLLLAGRDDQTKDDVVRLNPDGSIDPTFNIRAHLAPGFPAFYGGINNIVNKVAVQPDGKVLIVGAFSAVNGETRYQIARLNVDGSLDSTMGQTAIASDMGTSGQLNGLAVQPDGKVLIGGYYYSTSDGEQKNYVARLNPDGSLDAVLFSSVMPTVLALQADDKVLVGRFVTNGDPPVPGQAIGRLNADFSLDTSWGSDLGFVGTSTVAAVFSLLRLPDGKLLIGGMFNSINQMPLNNIARLNADGSLDTSFNPGTGANGDIYALAMSHQADILVGGAFYGFNDGAQKFLVRLRSASGGTVTPLVTAGSGAIYPSTPQWVPSGNAGISLTLSADPGYMLGSVGGTCGGSLSFDQGNYTYQTDAITTDCTVVVSFKSSTELSWTVTPSSVGNGRISPAAVQTVVGGDAVSFDLAPDAGYGVDVVDGSCGGSLIGLRYTTSAITGDCTVVVHYKAVAPFIFVVTASMEGPGSMSPATPQLVASGEAATFTFHPAVGFWVSRVQGTCGGILFGGVLTEGVFTTHSVTTDCTVIARYELIPVVTPTPPPDGVGSVRAVPALTAWPALWLAVLIGGLGSWRTRRFCRGEERQN